MKPEFLLNALEARFCDILEQAAFLCAEPDDQPGEVGGFRGSVAARLSFRGELDGTVTMIVDDAVAQELTSNLLGADAGVTLPAEMVRDAVGELLNMTTNHFLSWITDAKRTFDLAGPFVEAVAAGGTPAQGAGTSTRRLKVDARPVMLGLTLEGAPA